MSMGPKKGISKETVQRLAIALVTGATLLTGSCMFIIGPLGEEEARLAGETGKQREQLDANRKLLKMESKTNAEYEANRRFLSATMIEQMPPYINAMAWTTNYLRDVTDKHSSLRPGGKSEAGILVPPATGAVPLFEEYVFQVEVTGRYRDIGRFVAALEMENPILRIEGVDISRLPGDNVPGKPSSELRAVVRAAFQRFNKTCFKPEDWPDAPMPRPAGGGAKAAGGAKPVGGGDGA